ncbi:MAG TPA: universal stress protein [Pseudolysinimonas sp.]|jgi:nucleotide-binding universal stress UspA family protein|nr:universal stress protein [Pseudolysinimonas sp.]
MEHVVIGLIDERSDRFAIEWAIGRARTTPARIRLVTSLDPNGSNPEGQKRFLFEASERVRLEAGGAEVETQLADGPMLHQLVELSATAALVVVAYRPDPAIRNGRLPSLPVSLSARARCPVVIVPDDLQPQAGPIVVGVQNVDPSAAVAFAADEAIRTDRMLRLVHTWKSTSLDPRADHIRAGEVLRAAAERVRAAQPGIRLEVVLEEMAAHDGVISRSRDASLIVLGTHGIGRETGVVLGVIHLEVMVRGGVPLCVVPLTASVE